MAGEVEKLFSAVLRLPVDGTNDAVSPDNTPRWDSVSAITTVAFGGADRIGQRFAG
jgi:hypothetical protein